MSSFPHPLNCETNHEDENPATTVSSEDRRKDGDLSLGKKSQK